MICCSSYNVLGPALGGHCLSEFDLVSADRRGDRGDLVSLKLKPGGCDVGFEVRSSCGSGDWQRESSPSHASSLDTAGRSRRWNSRHGQRLVEGSAPALTTRGATRENTVSGPHGPRSTPENGTAPHFAHPVMRHQPAHMSRDTDVDDSRFALPADRLTPQTAGRNAPAQLTARIPYECSDCPSTRETGGPMLRGTRCVAVPSGRFDRPPLPRGSFAA
jgi:hypothetical protein